MAVIKHFTPTGGKHCVTNSLKQIFAYHGHPISEEMLLGLGAGLGFVYLNMKEAPMVSGRAKPVVFEQTIAKHLGITIKCKKSKEYDNALKRTQKLLDNNEPVLVFVDMPFLPYLNMEKNSHFGGHAVVLFGYDSNHFYVSDRDNSDYPIRSPKGPIKEDYHLVSYEDMKQARSSNFRPFPANNQYLEFDLTNPKPITKETLLTAIHLNCETMLYPEANLLGVKGIKKFSKEALKWKSFTEEKRKRTGITNYFMISGDGGTGGGIFRNMYGKFLIEASTVLENEKVKEMGEGFITVSNQWEKVAELLWELSELGKSETCDHIAALVKDIHKEEVSLFEALHTISL